MIPCPPAGRYVSPVSTPTAWWHVGVCGPLLPGTAHEIVWKDVDADEVLVSTWAHYLPCLRIPSPQAGRIWLPRTHAEASPGGSCRLSQARSQKAEATPVGRPASLPGLGSWGKGPPALSGPWRSTCLPAPHMDREQPERPHQSLMPRGPGDPGSLTAEWERPPPRL